MGPKIAPVVLVCSITTVLLACDDRPGKEPSQGEQVSSTPAVIETAWTQSAVERTRKLSEATLKKSTRGAFQYALPELRIYNSTQQLIFKASGVKPGKTAIILDRAISADKPTAGPTFHETLADLETSEHKPATEVVPGTRQVTIFDYWAEWCVPCKVLEKELLAWASTQPKGSVRIVRAEADLMKAARARGEKTYLIKANATGRQVKVEMRR